MATFEWLKAPRWPKGTGGMNQMAKRILSSVDPKGPGAALWEFTEQALDTAEELTDSELSIDEQLEQLKIALSWYMVSTPLKSIKTNRPSKPWKKWSVTFATVWNESGGAGFRGRLRLPHETGKPQNLRFGGLSEGQVKEMERRIEKIGTTFGFALFLSVQAQNMEFLICDESWRKQQNGERRQCHCHDSIKEKNRPSLVVFMRYFRFHVGIQYISHGSGLRHA